MNDPVARIARTAAERLASERGEGLGVDVEAALYAREQPARPQRYEPVAVGSLIVAVATLAWTVYKDLRKKTPSPPPEVIARRIRVELPQHAGADAKDADDHLIEVVVEETISAAGDDEEVHE